MTREKAIAKSRFMFALLQTQERNFARHSTTLPSKRLPFAVASLCLRSKSSEKSQVVSEWVSAKWASRPLPLSLRQFARFF
ncbi:hypothetical protein FLM08_00930 [Vibrio cholerae]|uniref:Uncharacterized protein n=1 Tax=Vibrio cholerae TaxID=666 RepID=A0A544C9J8_VIBCL|nr:hypothetical protein FLM08_00930 [Vibrio cholerae]TQP15302.1 hypothetical protein FLM02_07805 [Vibrio cholerae]